MQVSGKYLVLATFAIGFSMAGFSWWYNYNQSRLTAQFWGEHDAALIVGGDKVELLELSAPPAVDDSLPAGSEMLSGRIVDLTKKRGLVHLRYALTYDDDFVWNKQSEETLEDDNQWRYALRFSRGADQAVMLFTADFTKVAKLHEGPDQPRRVDSLPCPRLGPTIVEYLSLPDVGALPPADAK